MLAAGSLAEEHAMRRGATYRLTSGAIFFPPRLILWRLEWATGKGSWLRNQKKMGGLSESMGVGDAVGARGTNQEGARPVHDHVGRLWKQQRLQREASCRRWKAGKA